jgi:mannosylglycoprotein endo-beta-mannosidase
MGKREKLLAMEELLQLEYDLDSFYSEYLRGFESDDDKFMVLEKEKRKIFLLFEKEETWRQKSRINWIASRDTNTKFFHAYENGRKQVNPIWEITEDGTSVASQNGLQNKSLGYFQSLFKSQKNLTISNQLTVIRAYPRIFSKEEGQKIVDPVTLPELLSTLKGFTVSKSPGPDGWTVEFFLGFFYLLGKDLLEAVEESRRKGRVLRELNSTFLSLIPKRDKT